jgi:ketosteroid isomerase-like protein
VASPASAEIKALLEKGLGCWNRGEIDLMADDYADDAEVDTTAALPDGRCYTGREEFVRYFHDLWDAWDRLQMESFDVVDVGGRRYVAEVRLTGKGRSSGIEIDQLAGYLYTLREQDGKVARLQMFPSKDAALEAAGLRE